MGWFEGILFILVIALLVTVAFGIFSAINDTGVLINADAQANRDCVQLGYAGGEVAPDMPNALRCWIIILVDEKQ